MKLFISPHNDDETLFGAFTIARERPDVYVVFDSIIQTQRGAEKCDVETRQEETKEAIRILTHTFDMTPKVNVMFGGLSDASSILSCQEVVVSLMGDLRTKIFNYTEVWAPAFEKNGHTHHNLVAQAADFLFPGEVTHYLTYTRTTNGKSRDGIEVIPRSGSDISRKLRALACYHSQMQMDSRIGCWPHFLNDLKEYYAR